MTDTAEEKRLIVAALRNAESSRLVRDAGERLDAVPFHHRLQAFLNLSVADDLESGILILTSSRADFGMVP